MSLISRTCKDFPKVLVAIPTYEGKDYIFPQCYQAVLNFTYPNFEFIIMDNTKDINYFLKLKRRGYKNIHRIPRGDNSRQALANSQNFARKKMLDEGFDYLMFVESDLVPAPDSIERLMQHGKLVCGSLYFLGVNTKVPCVFLKEYNPSMLAMGTRLVGVHTDAEGRQSVNQSEMHEYINKGLKQVHGVGFGNTLFARSIIEQFNFWHDERFDNKHSDVYFYMDLDNAGIPVYVDTDFITPHFPSPWDKVKDR